MLLLKYTKLIILTSTVYMKGLDFMKAIIPVLDEKINVPLYLQIYNFIKEAILKNEIVPGEKLPSLRNLSDTLNVSLTTVDQAYAQLDVEGYIYSKPQSGYFVSDIYYPNRGKDTNTCMASGTGGADGVSGAGAANGSDSLEHNSFVPVTGAPEILEPDMAYDLECFDFNKWKKCINKVFTQYPHLLLFESDPQGEEILRHEIAKYVYTSRGVKCTADQIVIAAGTQQITSHLANILTRMNISNVGVEEPGYVPVNNIFRDRGFTISHIPVLKDGIDVDKLPTNISSAVYVNPSNQFPTGAVMPVGKRYKLLDWAQKNESYIIEDDYDSELRYFGRPIPSLQGLDNYGRVIYLGSFSSTLFPSVKISYMVLPEKMADLFRSFSQDYSQTCSKTEQLALAFFMEDGKYQTNIKKVRRLYSHKLQLVVAAFEKYGKNMVTPVNTSSGINTILSVKSNKSGNDLASEAKSLGLLIFPVKLYTEEADDLSMIFYYNRVPTEEIDGLIRELVELWEKGEC